MQRKTAIRIVGGLAHFIGFAGTVVGISRIFPVIVRPETLTPYSLMRVVGMAIVVTLVLVVFILVPLAGWAQIGERSDDDDV